MLGVVILASLPCALALICGATVHFASQILYFAHLQSIPLSTLIGEPLESMIVQRAPIRAFRLSAATLTPIGAPVDWRWD